MLIFVISGYLVINVCCVTPCGFFCFCLFLLIQFFKADKEEVCKRNRTWGAEEVNIIHASQHMVCEICHKK